MPLALSSRPIRRSPTLVVAGACLLLGSTQAFGVPLFDAPYLSYSATQRENLVAGDFDEDSHLDLVFGSSQLTLLRGVGDGTFGARSTFDVPSNVYNYPPPLALGDVNGDGHLDLVSAANQSAPASNTVIALLGDGDGGFTPVSSSSFSDYAKFSALGDVNADGDLDLVMVLSYYAQKLSVLLGNGDGTFGTEVLYPAPSQWTASVAIGDLNGDGHADLAIADPSYYGQGAGFVNLMFGNGDGTFGGLVAYTSGTHTKSVVIADVNSDGLPDLVASDYSSDGVSVFRALGSGFFGNRVPYGPAPHPLDVAVGDMNGDGHPDLVTANTAGNAVSVFPGIGDGTFGGPQNYRAGITPERMAVADFNDDGRLDIAVTAAGSRAVSVLLANDAGGFGTLREVSGGGISCLLLQDFNGDSKLDMISSSGGISLIPGNGDGTFGTPSSISLGSYSPVSIATGDLNGDGRLDLAVGTSWGGNYGYLAILLADGSGGFSSPVTYGLDCIARSVTIGDFDADGDKDVVGCCDQYYYGDGAIGLYRGNGDGTFAARQVAATLGATFVANIDLNSDGKLDLVTAKKGSYPYGNAILTLFGNGDGTFAEAVVREYETADAPRGVTIADFDQDGLDDVATTSYSGIVSLRLALGDARLGPRTDLAAGVGSTSIAAGDLNADGDLDLAVSNGGSYNVSVLLGHDDGTFDPHVDFGVGSHVGAIGIGDFDDDGCPDFAVTTGATISVHLGRSVPVTSVRNPLELARLTVNPNPMRDRVGIDYTVSHPGPVRLEVVDVQGRRVRMLDSGAKTVGLHRVTWDGRGDRGPAPAGLYFIRYQGVGKVATRRIALTR